MTDERVCTDCGRKVETLYNEYNGKRNTVDPINKLTDTRQCKQCISTEQMTL